MRRASRSLQLELTKRSAGLASTSAGTGSVLGGAMTMLVFWAGTVPVLLALGLGVQRVSGVARRAAPTVTALLLIGIGCLTVFGRMGRLRPPAPIVTTAQPVSHERAIERVESLSSSSVCCDDHPEPNEPASR